MISLGDARVESTLPSRRPHAAMLSIGLHAALLSAWLLVPLPTLHDMGAGALTVQLLVEAPPPEPQPPAPAPPEPAEPTPPEPAPQPKQPAPPKPMAKPAPTPRPAPVAAPTATQAPAETAAQPVMTAPAEAAETAPAASAVAIGNPAAREATQDDYMRIVWSRIMRYRPARVPQAGITRLRFTLDAGGELISAEVAESSGSFTLDRAAVDAVRRAAPFPPPPPSATPVHVFEIPFQFRPNT
ncbi:MAG: TonB family protein [Bacteroidales bacterium]